MLRFDSRSKSLFSCLAMGLIFSLCSVVSRPLQASTTYASPPIRLSRVNSVRLSPEVFRFGSKLRIRNLSSGASIVVDISSIEPYLPAGTLSRLVQSPEQEWLPEFSVLGGGEAPDALSPALLPPALRVRGQVMDSAGRNRTSAPATSVVDRSWRVLGYRVLKSPSGLLYLEVSDGVKTVFVTPEQAARRLELRERSNLAKLFDLGWRSLSIQRYDLGLEAFTQIQVRPMRLEEKQKAQLNLGLALSKYHIEGCSRALSVHLAEADRDPANQDDVSYYRALCAMNEEDYPLAEVLFKRLSDKQHQNYAEASAFYLGVIAEVDERYDDAEAAYLDTVDFAADGALVGIAKTRLENLRVIRAMESLDPKWISGGASLGGGWDTNVVALPAELTPASFGLSDQAAAVSTNLLFLSLAPPWSRYFSHTLNYNFLFNKHFDQSIAEVYDSNVHDLGTQLNFRTSSSLSHALAYSWSKVSLAPLGRSVDTLRTQTTSYFLKRSHGKNPERPDGDVEAGFKYIAIRPSRTVASSENSLSSNAFVVSLKIQNRRHVPHVFGPQFSFEARPSKGSENSMRDLRAGINWDYYFGNMASPWYLSQNGYFSYKPYYQSLLDRQDYALAYVGSLGRTWNAHLDTRLQYQGNLNFSTIKSLYQYRQSSVSLLITAFF